MLAMYVTLVSREFICFVKLMFTKVTLYIVYCSRDLRNNKRCSSWVPPQRDSTGRSFLPGPWPAQDLPLQSDAPPHQQEFSKRERGSHGLQCTFNSTKPLLQPHVKNVCKNSISLTIGPCNLTNMKLGGRVAPTCKPIKVVNKGKVCYYFNRGTSLLTTNTD